MKSRAAFTLVELLVVVAILVILSAIALPNFLEAQARAKVSAARSNMRVLLVGLESYAVDNNAYPPARPSFPRDALGLFADVQLRILSTPVGYVTAAAFADPFADVKPVPYAANAVNLARATSHPNPGEALLYYNYASIARVRGIPCAKRAGAAVVSIAPDRIDNFGYFRPLDQQCIDELYPYGGDPAPAAIDVVYDPTNGTTSTGDLFVGAGDGGRIVTP